MSLDKLHSAIAPVAPIDGVCLRTRTPPTVEIQFRPEATPQQRAAAQAVVDGWDWSEAAEVAREAAANPERTAVRAALAAIESDAAAWEAIAANATAAQTRAAVSKLTSHLVKIARYTARI